MQANVKPGCKCAFTSRYKNSSHSMKLVGVLAVSSSIEVYCGCIALAYSVASWFNRDLMADFPDDLSSICTQSLMAIEDNWNCEDENYRQVAFSGASTHELFSI